jgi:hypothetical protein
MGHIYILWKGNQKSRQHIQIHQHKKGYRTPNTKQKHVQVKQHDNNQYNNSGMYRL